MEATEQVVSVVDAPTVMEPSVSKEDDTQNVKEDTLAETDSVPKLEEPQPEPQPQSGVEKKSRELRDLLQFNKDNKIQVNISHKRRSVDPVKLMEKVYPKNESEASETRALSVDNGDDKARPMESENQQQQQPQQPNKLKRCKSLSTGAVDGAATDETHTGRKSLKIHPPTVVKPDKDKFCWRCHKDGVTICCETCPRSFHLKCLKQFGVSDPVHWQCPECFNILNAESTRTRSTNFKDLTLDQLCVLLKFAFKRMTSCGETEPFLKPVNENEFPDYKKCIINPMDLSKIEANLKSNMYGSTVAFEADTKWILHNSIIYNSYHSRLTNTAKSILKTCRREMFEIENCVSCYSKANTVEDWFVQSCPKPHILLWAKLKGFPYWPAKAMSTTSAGMVDCRFFGAHDRAWIHVKECYLYSEKDPNSSKQKKHELNLCLEEVNKHIEKLKEVFGEFRYAPHKTPYNPENEEAILKMFLPNYKSRDNAPGQAAPNGNLNMTVGSESDSFNSSSCATLVELCSSRDEDAEEAKKSKNERMYEILDSDEDAKAIDGLSKDTSSTSAQKLVVEGGTKRPASDDKLASVIPAKITRNDADAKPAEAEKMDESHAEISIKIEKEDEESKAEDAGNENKKQLETSVATTTTTEKDVNESGKPLDEKTATSRPESGENRKEKSVKVVKLARRSCESESPESRKVKIADQLMMKLKELDHSEVTIETVKVNRENQQLLPEKNCKAGEESSANKVERTASPATTLTKLPSTSTKSVKRKEGAGGGGDGKEVPKKFIKLVDIKSITVPKKNESILEKQLLNVKQNRAKAEKLQQKAAESSGTEPESESESLQNKKEIFLALNIQEKPCAGEKTPKQREIRTRSKTEGFKTKLVRVSHPPPVVNGVVVPPEGGAKNQPSPATTAAPTPNSNAPKQKAKKTFPRPGDAGKDVKSYKAAEKQQQPAVASSTTTTPTRNIHPKTLQVVQNVSGVIGLIPVSRIATGTGVAPLQVQPLTQAVSGLVGTSQMTQIPGLVASSMAALAPLSGVSVTAPVLGVSTVTTAPRAAPSTVQTTRPVPALVLTTKPGPSAPPGGKEDAQNATVVNSNIPTPASLNEQVVSILTSIAPQNLTQPVVNLICRSPPPIYPKPLGILQAEFQDLTPSTAGKATEKINSIAYRISDYFRGMLIETIKELSGNELPDVTITNLKLEMERLKHKHQEEIVEIKRNFSTLLEDIQRSIAEEKVRIVNETKANCEANALIRVQEAKSKQWCANCFKEAQFYCCWNTSYCDFPCQRNHWPKHMNKCAQSVTSIQGSTIKPAQVKVTLSTGNVAPQLTQPRTTTTPKIIPIIANVNGNNSAGIVENSAGDASVKSKATSKTKTGLGADGTNNNPTMIVNNGNSSNSEDKID